MTIASELLAMFAADRARGLDLGRYGVRVTTPADPRAEDIGRILDALRDDPGIRAALIVIQERVRALVPAEWHPTVETLR